jgi:hypothetical protein
MWLRTVCIAFLLLTGPITTQVASRCCSAVETCCDEEGSDCPAPPGGECSLSEASPVLATLNTGNGQQSPLIQHPFELAPTCSGARGTTAGPEPGLYRPRIPLVRALRI